MAHWFHRNVFKATTMVNFEIKMVALDTEALKICSDLKNSRKRLLDILPDANHAIETIETAFTSYLALMQGFITSFDGDGRASKLRHSIVFKWTHSLLGNTPHAEQDAMYELANMSINVGIWFMKHAAMIAGKDDITMDEAKEVHTSLRKAAGVFQLATQTFIPQMVAHPDPGTDLDLHVAGAYLAQCTAEAQESSDFTGTLKKVINVASKEMPLSKEKGKNTGSVTVARAIELKHNAALISALAHETSKLFTEAADLLGPLSEKVAGQWRKYLQLKAAFYLAYAYNYCGENELSLDKCGEGIRALQESQKCYAKAEALCKEYGKAKGSGKLAKPEQHLFFRKLAPVVTRTLEKCERENGFIYHQKVPYDPPQLELKATYGLVKPESMTMPPPSPLWNPASYAAFDTAMANARDPANSKSSAKEEGDLAPVKEVNVHQSGSDPKNSSGCSLQ